MKSILLIAAGVVFAVILFRFIALPFLRLRKYPPREGDILFQSMPRVKLVKAIEGCSQSCYSHCGVIIKRNGRWRISEAMIFGVREVPLWFAVARGRGARFAVFRLKDGVQHHAPAFVKALEKCRGRPYDFSYRFDDNRLYCSELVYKAFRDAARLELGEMKALGELNWKPYEKILRTFGGGDLPLDRTIITPRHLSESEFLERVFSAGI